MIKGLFFTAALLVPSLAYSANPSANLSVQVVPSSSNGIACDIGPNYKGTIPGPAVAMGFTTCLNFDFTYTGTFSNRVAFTNAAGTNIPAGQSYQWSNQSSWLAEAGATHPLFAGGTFSSNAYQLVSDGGSQVLLSQYIPGDNAPQINTPFYPITNKFLEEEARVDPLAYQNVTSEINGEVIDDFGFFGEKPGGTAGLEVDAGFGCVLASPGQWSGGGQSQACGGNGSFYVSANGSSFTGQPSYPPCCNINIADGNYHTTGMLAVASRTNNTIATCAYYDKQWADGKGFGPCWAPGSAVGQGDACTHETSAACWEMGTNSIGTYVNGATQITARHWVRRITIWTCPGWNTPSASGNGYTALNSCDSAGKVFNAVGGSQNGPSY
jgi:hypothetical protein